MSHQIKSDTSFLMVKHTDDKNHNFKTNSTELLSQSLTESLISHQCMESSGTETAEPKYQTEEKIEEKIEEISEEDEESEQIEHLSSFDDKEVLSSGDELEDESRLIQVLESPKLSKQQEEELEKIKEADLKLQCLRMSQIHEQQMNSCKSQNTIFPLSIKRQKSIMSDIKYDLKKKKSEIKPINVKQKFEKITYSEYDNFLKTSVLIEEEQKNLKLETQMIDSDSEDEDEDLELEEKKVSSDNNQNGDQVVKQSLKIEVNMINPKANMIDQVAQNFVQEFDEFSPQQCVSVGQKENLKLQQQEDMTPTTNYMFNRAQFKNLTVMVSYKSGRFAKDLGLKNHFSSMVFEEKHDTVQVASQKIRSQSLSLNLEFKGIEQQERRYSYDFVSE